MIKIEFSDSDKAALSYERFHHPHPFGSSLNRVGKG